METEQWLTTRYTNPSWWEQTKPFVKAAGVGAVLTVLTVALGYAYFTGTPDASPAVPAPRGTASTTPPPHHSGPIHITGRLG
ncbi:hypothetical protein ACIBK8_33020 [Streptomyces sp. NPDC050161]|uniref:hypothetical protein n=1 Tax=Streptomyces sp. NPDC050161 TaxID=3365604 RepID=UPI00379916DB